MSELGFFTIDRIIFENPIVCKDSDHFAIWCYLIGNATHKQQKKLFKGEKITLKRGQLITGRKKLAEFFNIKESKVQRILKSFESEQQIEQQTCNKNRLITVVNYDKFQKFEQQNEQQVNNKRTTSEQQVNTNNNETMKQCKKRLNTYSENFEKFWKVYPKRVNKKAAFNHWKKICTDDSISEEIIKCVEDRLRNDIDWTKENCRFVVHPERFLRDERWKDQYKNMNQPEQPKKKLTELVGVRKND